MKHATLTKDGFRIEVSDGDKRSDDIVELHGELADKAEENLVRFAEEILSARGYKITKDV